MTFTWFNEGLFMGFFVDHHIAPGIALAGMLIDLLGEKEAGREETFLRAVARIISYGIAGMFLGLLGFALGFPAASLFHFRILDILGYFSSLGELLGYTIGWGFAVPLGYMLSSRN